MNTIHLVLASVLLLQAGVAVISDDSACRRPLTCIPISECTSKHRHNSDLNAGIIFDCGMNQQGRKVCCPPLKTPRPPATKPGTTKPGTTKPSPIDNRAANMKLLPTLDCGFASTERISAGENATIGQFPWMALLGYKVGSDPATKFLCGGTLINNRYILTAAHCVNSPTITPVSIRLGELNIDTNPDCFANVETENVTCSALVKDVGVAKVIVHPNFSPTLLRNDIALIRLKNQVEPTEDIRPICLPFGLNVTGAEEKKYFIAGWGKTSANNEAGSPMMKFAKVTSSSIEDCNALQAKESAYVLTESQLCAGGGAGEDACKGDSGGPLMSAALLPQSESPQWVQLGIVSFGLLPCGSPSAPSGYTRVTAYLDWILDNITK